MAPISASSEGRDLARALGSVIRTHRVSLGWSQEKFAEKTNLHPNQIGFLERGERVPNIQTVLVVAKALKLKTSELLAEAGF